MWIAPAQRENGSMSQATAELKAVGEIAVSLPDVKENVTRRGTGWKVKGRLMTCEAIHKSAEKNSLMVRVSTQERDRLIEEQPDIFYLTDHYRPYDAVLVRLSRVDQESLRELLQSSWRFVREAP
jgi:hypothetical protein